MDKSKILDWQASGTAPDSTLLSSGYNPLDTPKSSNWNEILYNIFQTLLTLADESNDSPRKTNYSPYGNGVNLAYNSAPRFVSMSGGNSSLAEGNVGTQAVTEDFTRGRIVLSDSTSPASPVAFRGAVTAQDGYLIEWSTNDPSLSIPYTVSFDVMKENIDITTITVEPATVSQAFVVENFKVLGIEKNSTYSRVSFTFRLRKTESSILTTTTLMSFLLKVNTTAIGSRTSVGVTGMTLTKGSVNTGFSPNAIDATIPRALSLAGISLNSYIGKSTTFSSTIASASSSLGLGAGTYFGIHVKPPKAMSNSSTNTSNAQIISDGSKLYFRVFEDSAVASTAFKTTPTMADVTELLSVYAKTEDMNNAISNALLNYYTKSEVDTNIYTKTQADAKIDSKISTFKDGLNTWTNVDTGMPTRVLADGDDLDVVLSSLTAGAYLIVNNAGNSIKNSPAVNTFSDVIKNTSSEAFMLFVNVSNFTSTTNMVSAQIVTKGASSILSMSNGTYHTSSSVTKGSTTAFKWISSLSTTASKTLVNGVIDDINNIVVKSKQLVWTGLLVTKGTSMTFSLLGDSPNHDNSTPPAYINIIYQWNTNASMRTVHRVPWSVVDMAGTQHYTDHPTTIQINPTNMSDSGTTIIFGELRIGCSVDTAKNEVTFTINGNDRMTYTTANPATGIIGRDADEIRVVGVELEWDEAVKLNNV